MPININGNNYEWYDLTFLSEIQGKIDLLIVDGPPRVINREARYPAVPQLRSLFTDKTVIIMDDGNRKDDSTTAELWVKELSHYQCEYRATEKGAFILSPKEANDSQ